VLPPEVRRDIEIIVLPMERLLNFDGLVLYERVESNSDVGSSLGVTLEGADGVLSANVAGNVAEGEGTSG